jgi:hypothetical protein
MKVRQDRLLGVLKAHGFSYGPEPRTSDDIVFTRPSHLADLYESIILGGQGRQREAVSAEVGISVTRRVMYKLLGDVRFLAELGEDQQRGWTMIEDDVKARQWEARLAEVGPVKAKEWAEARGPRLLQQTLQARSAANKYLALLRPAKNLAETLTALRNFGDRRVLDEAERLAACPLFGDGPDVESAYRVACHLIASHSDEVDGKSWFGHDPVQDTALLERVEILADKLFHADQV